MVRNNTRSFGILAEEKPDARIRRVAAHRVFGCGNVGSVARNSDGIAPSSFDLSKECPVFQARIPRM
jgi:hypothetical protein